MRDIVLYTKTMNWYECNFKDEIEYLIIDYYFIGKNKEKFLEIFAEASNFKIKSVKKGSVKKKKKERNVLREVNKI